MRKNVVSSGLFFLALLLFSSPKVLIATDFSECSEDAFNEGVDLSSQLKAKMILRMKRAELPHFKIFNQT